jgi:hypothetical protein
MKFRNLLLLLSLLAFSSLRCHKDKIDSNDLPPATQEGKNTLGFMLNGQQWTPQGVRGTANLSIDYDAGFDQGIFNIVAYNFIPTISEQFIIGVRDSLNFIQSPITLQLSRTSLYGISYNKPCDYFNQLNDVQSSGSLTITKLDRTNRIIAGTFNAILYKTGCDTVRITDGRFDMKF